MLATLGGEFVSPPIGEAATDAAFEDFVSACRIRQLAGVVAQIELRTVAAKVGFAHVVIGADHAALEDGEEVFSGVGVVEHAAHVFLDTVVHRAVIRELAAHLAVDGAFVSQERAGTVDMGNDQCANVLGIDVGNMKRTGAAIALD